MPTDTIGLRAHERMREPPLPPRLSQILVLFICAVLLSPIICTPFSAEPSLPSQLHAFLGLEAGAGSEKTVDASFTEG